MLVTTPAKGGTQEACVSHSNVPSEVLEVGSSLAWEVSTGLAPLGSEGKSVLA